eukprot:CAMPEP_0198263610 /NCGR_PEP_ID=MMETSP1447-20131203/12815_1 /TAXON_ID=420782 /ORGANISM="Chaetoceros dichaeta, Strain CCMP1751" /LENGTH=30 /DNA_ID= /DNA_START= /DNA_END= /DNA_ORIENTATION=
MLSRGMSPKGDAMVFILSWLGLLGIGIPPW